MEVVLSPGRFGDEVPGAPFHNEEIREWSHVDRLTGMLERARVETGRWKTLNEGAARSYGKVIDSRERNSADGSVVQRARRQVEVFQSQAPGRSVQVVRASQWSSSRVTDSTTTSPLALHSLAQEKKKVSGSAERSISSSSRLKRISPSSSLCRDEDISERLSSLLGSFANHTSSSTVPLRRIDSKYATRTPISLPISKRSSSNENLTSHSELRSDRLGAFLRESNSRISLEEGERLSLPSQIKESPLEEARQIIHEISIEREEEEKDYENRLKVPEESAENSQTLVAIDECRQPTNKAAIQLLPSSKANTTVVNLINVDTKSEKWDNREVKPQILSWVLPSSVNNEEEKEEGTPVEAEEETRREPKLEETAMPFSPTRSVKRVGFCKTEIHFAADSGKVNIVETDGKPPPTNKFRRRRRNSLTGCSNAKNNVGIENIPVLEARDSGEQRNVEDNKTRIDPNLQRGHTTTVNLGYNISSKNQRSNRDTGSASDSVEKDVKRCCPLHLVGMESELEASREVCNVVCTDADNNQVLLKVVTTHEPTIARVESDHLRKKIKASITEVPPPSLLKKERRSSKGFISSDKKIQAHKEHTYVNVFTGSKRAPIYENYKIEPAPTIEAKIGANLGTSNISSPEKNLVDNTKSQNLVLKSRDLDSIKLERLKNASAAAASGKLYSSKKIRDKTKDSKMPREEIASANISSHSSSRGRSAKLLTKNPKASVSSSEASARLNVANNLTGNNSNALKSARNATAKITNKGEIVKKQKPVEVVYQTAVYNMKNEKLKKPQKGKEPKGPRYFNELICGAKIKRPSDSKNGKTTITGQHVANNKTALQPIKHWK